jgi:hypothetical protein
MPAGVFRLGDSTAAANPDERPSALRHHASYCIEATEHLDSTGKFQVRVTWQQAERICRELSPADGTHLCTEAEWERSCETLDSVPLTYGVQSEKTDPSNLRFHCNIGIGDSAMALDPALRHPSCLTSEGVCDFPGNLAEWVLDVYSPTAYASAPDTLLPNSPLTAPQDSGLHAYRGWHYLDSLPPAAALAQARCSNRDYPLQVRRRAYPGCMDADQPLLVVVYNNSPTPRCLPPPDSLQGSKITGVSPARDSTQLTLLVEGRIDPVVWTMPTDTAYRGMRPIDAKITPLAMAAVTFVNSETGETVADTLDALEMRDTSLAKLEAIFAREAAPPWSVRKENGKYAIQYIYAHSELRGKPARAHYSNATMGFRCCSLPRGP